MTSHFWSIRQAITPPCADEQTFFLLRAPARPHRRKRRFTEKDLFLLVQQATLALGAAATPAELVAEAAASHSFKRRTTRRGRELGLFSDKVLDLLGAQDDAEIAALYDAVQRRLDERQMTYLRERFSRQPMASEVSGLEHIEASLAKDCGAILWNTPALGDTIVTKRALFVSGVRPYQLSVRSHGFSQSQFPSPPESRPDRG
ncbi:MAG: hypothetical protein U5K36_15995 [Roseovarius sp.]|nr:hypothetical protein [Roseovarius sp.]